MADLAPGGPGIPPTWTSSAKDLVTTASRGRAASGRRSGFGIVNEVYWPSTGEPQIRDLGFIVAASTTALARGQARPRLHHRHAARPTSRCPRSSTRETATGSILEVLPHPQRDVLLIRYRLDGRGAGSTRSWPRISAARLGQHGLGRRTTCSRPADRLRPLPRGRCRLLPGQRRLCRRLRRLAGLRPERRHDLDLRRGAGPAMWR